MSKLWNIAIVGATGAVGSQLIECLEEREFPVGSIRYLACNQDVGRDMEFSGKAVLVEELAGVSFAGIDIVLFCAGKDISRVHAPVAAASGAVCIDCSGAWGDAPDVPVVVPEVNPDAVAGYLKKGIVASPGGTAIQLAIALQPIHAVAGIRRMTVTSYQAVSGTGPEAIEELRAQVGELLNCRPVQCTVYPAQIAFNCIPHVGSFTDNGFTDVEAAIALETARVLGGDIRITVTAVQAPVFYGDAASVFLETGCQLAADDARKLLSKGAGIKLVDDPARNSYPMPLYAAGQDQVHVGRVREDASTENGLALWAVADNIRVAAVNAVRIAELLVESHLQKM